MKDYKPTPLLDQKLALSRFLEDLLHEPALPAAVEPATEAGLAVPAPEVPRPAKVQPVLPAEPSPGAGQITAPVTPEIAEAEAEPEPGWDRPEWAHQPFQIMLFKVAGLTLAVPLETLSGVVEWPERLTEMPGHADFYLGILQYLGNSVPVVDTARLVFPQERLPELDTQDPTDRCRRIVLINDGCWGLACQSVEEVVTLRPEQVRWRSQRTRRRWLLGTVIDHMCALLDTDAFAERLASGEE